jgi:hypothetical protein
MSYCRDVLLRATGNFLYTQVVSSHPKERHTETNAVRNAEVINVLGETKLNSLYRDITLVSLSTLY